MIEIAYGPAHTDGDISVTFGEAEILHAADTYWNGICSKALRVTEPRLRVGPRVDRDEEMIFDVSGAI